MRRLTPILGVALVAYCVWAAASATYAPLVLPAALLAAIALTMKEPQQ